MMKDASCMNCKHQGMQFCPFNKGYTGWADVFCSKHEWKVHSPEKMEASE